MDGGDANLFTDIARSFLSLLDRMVYFFIDLLISLFDSLTSIRIFGNDAIATLSTRIYALIAIIMIFKVSFSIIQYIINPDNFSDKERGFGKTIRNVILTLVALVITPNIFNLAYNIQNYATQHQLVEKIILGVNNTTAEKQRNSKNELALRILNIFVQPNIAEIPEFSYKNNRYYCTLNGNDNPMFNDLGEYNKGFGDCLWQLDYDRDGKNYQYNGKTYNGDDSIYNLVWESNDYAILLDIVNDKYYQGVSIFGGTIYLFDYKFLISTAVGVFVLIMYLNFCIDLAIRSVKFAFLQLIAPIPIISMIDPKSSKSGPMSKWLNACFSTYIGLFIRIAAVSFVIVVINIVFSSSVLTTNGTQINDFIKLVIVLGALLFAKELPKLLSDIIGVNFGGEFKLNPLLRIPGGKMATRALTGTAFAAGAVGGATLGVAGRGIVTTLATPGQALMHKIFPNRTASVGEMWSNAGNAMLDRLSVGGQRALRNLNSAIPRPFRNGPHGQGGNNAPITRPRQELREGERLYGNVQNAVTRATENAKRNGIQDGSSEMQNVQEEAELRTLYQHQQFRDLVRARDVAKQQMQEAQRNAARMEIISKNGDPAAAEQYADAIQAQTAAEKKFDKTKQQIDKFKDIYARDYRNYVAYNDAKDRHELDDLQSNATTSSQSTTPSVSTSSGVAPSGPAPSGPTSSGSTSSRTSSSSTIDYGSIDMGPSRPSSSTIDYGSIDMSEPSNGPTPSRTTSNGATSSRSVSNGPAPSRTTSSSTIDYGAIDMGSSQPPSGSTPNGNNGNNRR